MPPGVVAHVTKEKFAEQFGTLWKASEAYFDGDMHPIQAAAFERVIEPAFLAAVAQTRLFHELTRRVAELMPQLT